MARRGELAKKEEHRLTIMELPAGCGPLSPTLVDIFGREVSEDELREAQNGIAFSQISRESKVLTALSSASPAELGAHVQVRQLNRMTFHDAPLLVGRLFSYRVPCGEV